MNNATKVPPNTAPASAQTIRSTPRGSPSRSNRDGPEYDRQESEGNTSPSEIDDGVRTLCVKRATYAAYEESEPRSEYAEDSCDDRNDSAGLSHRRNPRGLML